MRSLRTRPAPSEPKDEDARSEIPVLPEGPQPLTYNQTLQRRAKFWTSGGQIGYTSAIRQLETDHTKSR